MQLYNDIIILLYNLFIQLYNWSKLYNYYKQTNCINLSKRNTLKNGNNAETTKTQFSIKWLEKKPRKCFFQELKQFLRTGV